MMKRALAYHSVENIGIIVLGLGLSVVFMSYGLTALAALALLASMYHSLNHALFKSLLFMGAGSVISSTNTRDLNRMGGLARVMPWTSLLFLIGSIAITGLPPTEWFRERMAHDAGITVHLTRCPMLCCRSPLVSRALHSH